MADVAENLKTFVQGDAAIAARIGLRMSYSAIPQGKPFPFIWYQRTGTDNLRCLGETTTSPFFHTFALEIVSDDLNEVEALAPLVRAKLETLACGGAMGDMTVANVFCEDQSADYVPQSADANIGEHIVPLQVEVYP